MLEYNTWDKLRKIVRWYERNLQDQNKHLFNELITTGETMELLEEGYVTKEQGKLVWNGKTLDCWDYKPTLKGWKLINKEKLVPFELGGGQYNYQVAFTGTTKELCRKYLPDEKWDGGYGSIVSLYFYFWKALKSQPFFACKDLVLFRRLNKKLLEEPLNGVIPFKTYERLLLKVNAQYLKEKEGS